MLSRVLRLLRDRVHIGAAHGSALLPTILLMFLFSAIAMGAALVVRVEVSVAERFRQSAEALYAAESGLDLVVSELRTVPDWTPVVDGPQQSAFADGSFSGTKRVPGGGTVSVCCGAGSAFDRLMTSTRASSSPGRRTLAWRAFLWAPFDAVVSRTPPSRFYLLVYVADDEDDGGGGETNGLILVRAEAVDPGGISRSIETLIARRLAEVAPDAPAAPLIDVVHWRDVR